MSSENKIQKSDECLRKFTPRECFRLMGLRDNEIDRIENTKLSDSRKYSMAGNSIVVEPMFRALENLFYPDNQIVNNTQQ